ncbi:hypothetical protein [Streptomyces sp. NPDC055036]
MEGTILQAVAIIGVHGTRCIGMANSQLALLLTATAINLIRIHTGWNAPARTAQFAYRHQSPHSSSCPADRK